MWPEELKIIIIENTMLSLSPWLQRWLRITFLSESERNVKCDKISFFVSIELNQKYSFIEYSIIYCHYQT